MVWHDWSEPATLPEYIGMAITDVDDVGNVAHDQHPCNNDLKVRGGADGLLAQINHGPYHRHFQQGRALPAAQRWVTRQRGSHLLGDPLNRPPARVAAGTSDPRVFRHNEQAVAKPARMSE